VEGLVILFVVLVLPKGLSGLRLPREWRRFLPAASKEARQPAAEGLPHG